METSMPRPRLLVASASLLGFAFLLATGAPARAAEELKPLSSLPHTPSLDPAAMDKSVDPCVDFYRYSCGSWNKNNPMPADRTRWDVYGKVTQDNQAYLWGLLLDAAKPGPGRTPEQQKIGDYFAACMDEAAVEGAGTKPIAAKLAAIDALASVADLPPLLARLQDGTSTPLFGFS